MASLEEQIEATRHTLETLEDAKFKRDEELEKLKNANQKYNMQEIILTNIVSTLSQIESRLELVEKKIDNIETSQAPVFKNDLFQYFDEIKHNVENLTKILLIKI